MFFSLFDWHLSVFMVKLVLRHPGYVYVMYKVGQQKKIKSGPKINVERDAKKKRERVGIYSMKYTVIKTLHDVRHWIFTRWNTCVELSFSNNLNKTSLKVRYTSNTWTRNFINVRVPPTEYEFYSWRQWIPGLALCI